MQAPPLGLYIHLPWCERKCPYCDFNSHEAGDFPEGAYVAALLRDLQNDWAPVRQRTISSVFIGGGTPSLFSGKAIATLLEGVTDLVTLGHEVETTMEANPGSAEAEKFCAFREAGINRLSIGVQSFHDDALALLGRVHNSEQARRAIGFAQAAGFDSFNIDLMHGLPGQNTDSAAQDLRTAISYRPEHISWYQLTIEPNTAFHKRSPVLPVEDELADIQQAGEQLLCREGYSQYEVSAYSKAGFSCRHNRNYWSFGDYLGIGAGAHGKVTSADGQITRYAKTRSPQDYLAAASEKMTASRRVLSTDDVVGEFMMNALRLNEGFTLSQFTANTGLGKTLIVPRLHALCERGLLISESDTVKATELGRRFLDSVVGEFFTG